ncbi:hypothetical protein [Streptacidiphilus sp. MAP5-52]|uniref:hypothetical protein n=1 Tax=Streptacidiphilus sp. MAP5-52 TaxID=3156267 RepID=UPI003513C34C
MFARSRTARAAAAHAGTQQDAADHLVADDTFVEIIAAMAGPESYEIVLTRADQGYARTAAAYGVDGHRLTLEPVIRKALARWITQRFPDLDSQRTYVLRLDSGHLALAADEHPAAA